MEQAPEPFRPVARDIGEYLPEFSQPDVWRKYEEITHDLVKEAKRVRVAREEYMRRSRRELDELGEIVFGQFKGLEDQLRFALATNRRDHVWPPRAETPSVAIALPHPYNNGATFERCVRKLAEKYELTIIAYDFGRPRWYVRAHGAMLAISCARDGAVYRFLRQDGDRAISTRMLRYLFDDDDALPPSSSPSHQERMFVEYTW